MRTLALTGSRLSLGDLRDIADRRVRVTLAPSARRAIAASRRVVDRAVSRNDRAYGVTTGFGKFAEVAVPRAELERLQKNLVRSHSAGVGDPLPDKAVRAMIALRVNALAKGFSGIRASTIGALLDLLAADVLPIVPSQGSVGASGDLAPLAHLALGLLGEGRARYRGREVSAARALASAGLAPVTLAAKE
ncbi:MAG TPA: aromatic amino acid lyase, partial [Thermoanaerobaculia bacterium]|nr:aromatic amino acid lyase [Thermoanaerobaculia bacterium]